MGIGPRTDGARDGDRQRSVQRQALEAARPQRRRVRGRASSPRAVERVLTPFGGVPDQPERVAADAAEQRCRRRPARRSRRSPHRPRTRRRAGSRDRPPSTRWCGATTAPRAPRATWAGTRTGPRTTPIACHGTVSTSSNVATLRRPADVVLVPPELRERDERDHEQAERREQEPVDAAPLRRQIRR